MQSVDEQECVNRTVWGTVSAMQLSSLYLKVLWRCPADTPANTKQPKPACCDNDNDEVAVISQ